MNIEIQRLSTDEPVGAIDYEMLIDAVELNGAWAKETLSTFHNPGIKHFLTLTVENTLHPKDWAFYVMGVLLLSANQGDIDPDNFSKNGLRYELLDAFLALHGLFFKGTDVYKGLVDRITQGCTTDLESKNRLPAHSRVRDSFAFANKLCTLAFYCDNNPLLIPDENTLQTIVDYARDLGRVAYPMAKIALEKMGIDTEVNRIGDIVVMDMISLTPIAPYRERAKFKGILYVVPNQWFVGPEEQHYLKTYFESLGYDAVVGGEDTDARTSNNFMGTPLQDLMVAMLYSRGAMKKAHRDNQLRIVHVDTESPCGPLHSIKLYSRLVSSAVFHVLPMKVATIFPLHRVR